MPEAAKPISNKISKLNLDIFTTSRENKETEINENTNNSNKIHQIISIKKKISTDSVRRRNGTDENQIRIFNGIENENENVINGISTDNLLPTNNKINDDEINNINNNNNYRRLNTDLFHSKNNCKRNEVSDKCKLILKSNKNLASNNNQEQKKVIVQIQ